MNLYTLIKNLAEQNETSLYTNPREKNIKIGKTMVVENGKLVSDSVNTGGEEIRITSLIDTPEDITELYDQYKHSVPGEKDSYKRAHFIALDAVNLSDSDMINGKPRREAKVLLEAYIILAAMTGHLTWKDPNRWYTTGYELIKDSNPAAKEDHDFIILKSYIE